MWRPNAWRHPATPLTKILVCGGTSLCWENLTLSSSSSPSVDNILNFYLRHCQRCDNMSCSAPTCTYFQASLLFVGKARNLHSELTNIRLAWKKTWQVKNNCLFCHTVRYEKSFYNIATLCQCYQLFLSLAIMQNKLECTTLKRIIKLV